MKKKKTSSESFLLSRLIKPVILFVLIILVYSKTTDFGYTNFDDRQHIVYQEEFYQEDYSALKAFTHDVFPSKTYNDVYYRPLLTLTLLMDYKRGGTDPAPYHGTNLVLFILAVLFLYYLIRNFTRAKHLAFALTALYALHPMFTSTVAWIPGRNDSLLAIFAFSGFIFLIKYLNNTDSNKWFFLHLLALTLALFTKESAVVLIPLFGLFIYLFRDRKTLFNKHHLQVGGPGSSWQSVICYPDGRPSNILPPNPMRLSRVFCTISSHCQTISANYLLPSTCLGYPSLQT